MVDFANTPGSTHNEGAQAWRPAAARFAPYCWHHETGECGSCPLFDVPYGEQLATRYDAAAATLADVIPDEAWLPPVESPAVGIRNRAKMAVTGTIEQPKLGLTTGVDLCDCQIYLPALRDAFPAIKQFITLAKLQPYDLTPSSEKITPAKARSRGELKYVIVTAASSFDGAAGELMITFVLRSTADLARIKSKLPWLQKELPNLKVVSVNIHPEHKATIIGDKEIVLTEQNSLPMDLGIVKLNLGPVSFFQTNTYIAQKLYETAAEWVNQLESAGFESSPNGNSSNGVLRIWDLYCGVGGFALSLAGPHRKITGIELSPEAIANAKAAAAGINGVWFESQDATRFAVCAHKKRPDLVVVNPPRRGIGSELTKWLNDLYGIPYILYSSCNPITLATDLEKLSHYKVVKAQLFDMFPNTAHSEILTLLVHSRSLP